MNLLAPIHALFNQPRARKLFLKLRLPLGLAAAAGIAWLIRREHFGPGLAVSFVGALWQWWCFSCIMTSQKLAVRGPYMMVRNPMYLARYLLVLGIVLMTGNPWIVAGYTALYYFYMVNRVRREEIKLREIFGADYDAYCRDVPRFLPGFKRFAWRDLFYFNPTCFQRNHGFINLLVVLAAYALLYAWVQYRPGSP